MLRLLLAKEFTKFTTVILKPLCIEGKMRSLEGKIIHIFIYCKKSAMAIGIMLIATQTIAVSFGIGKLSSGFLQPALIRFFLHNDKGLLWQPERVST